MNYGELLLSKVIDTNDINALLRFHIDESHFLTEGERSAYRFIRDYAEQNRGQAPSYATVVGEIDGFTYIPEVGDSYEYLTRRLKEGSAKLQIAGLIEKEASEKFTQLDGISFADWLISEVESIKLRTYVRSKVGTDVKTDTSEFLAEYRRRKEGKSFRIWKSKFPTINREIGGYLSSNMYTWYARSGRGKSVFTMEEAIEAAMQGANVLIWALEMSRYEWMARAYSSISARQGLLRAEIDGQEYEAGFENKALLMGQLSEDFERGLETFLSVLQQEIPGSITLRAIDDESFGKYDCRQLEADIIETKADVAVIDPIYYMSFEANTSKTAGGDVAATSKKLRQIAGKHSVVLHVITQADEVKDDKGEDGTRELRPPSRAEIKKTKAVLEDASAVLGIDTIAKEGVGVIYVGKGRAGGEDSYAEILYLPGYGIVREMDTGEAAAAQFESAF